ncbi:MAG TPA: hypothetical protein PK880_08915 [Candidatus Competibacter sp.]|nr:hypothetical protein [Candidatus Competibacteraceae bacterium]HRC72642.1 hypothetical protein [Candidatus Competibacter sp.]
MVEQRQSWSVEEKLATVLAVSSERQSVAQVSRQRGARQEEWGSVHAAGRASAVAGPETGTTARRLS